MNHFSYPLTIVQINIFVKPQNIFPNQNPRPQTIEPSPRIFNYRVPPWAVNLQPSCWLIGTLFSTNLISMFSGALRGQGPSGLT